MNWQEYQNAVGVLYEQLEGIGKVHKSVTLPDKVTSQPRQVDVWVEISTKNHMMSLLVDAKFRKDPLDVKDIEEVAALATSVGANKSVIVALAGWTRPAEIKANHIGLDLRVLTLEDALDLIVKDKWMLCSECGNDCIVMDVSGGIITDGMIGLFTAGRCRECGTSMAWCWDCGARVLLRIGEKFKCDCGHWWQNSKKHAQVKPSRDTKWMPLAKDLTLLA